MSYWFKRLQHLLSWNESAVSCTASLILSGIIAELYMTMQRSQCNPRRHPGKSLRDKRFRGQRPKCRSDRLGIAYCEDWAGLTKHDPLFRRALYLFSSI
jgi:hypothetical protein